METPTNYLNEASFVIFPKRDGLLVHRASGVAFQPTWRGADALHTMNEVLQDLKDILGTKDDSGQPIWMLNPRERPFDPARQQSAANDSDSYEDAPPQQQRSSDAAKPEKPARAKNELDEAIDDGILRETVVKVELMKARSGKPGYALYKNFQDKPVVFARVFLPKLVERVGELAGKDLSGMDVGDATSVTPFIAKYKKGAETPQGGNYNDVVALEAAS